MRLFFGFVLSFLLSSFVLTGCAPGAYGKWSDDGTVIQVENATPCGKAEIRPVGSSKGLLFQVRFLQVIPAIDAEKIRIQAYRSGDTIPLRLTRDFQSFMNCDSCFLVFPTANTGLSIDLHPADSCIIDLSEVITSQNNTCISRPIVIAPSR